MKEIVFVKTNIDRWKSFESALDAPASMHPDLLADLYIQLTDDLAYARTYFPRSETIGYLNMLAVRAHHIIFKAVPESSNRFKTFWKMELPLILFENRRYIFYALFIFLLAAIIGVMSQAFDPEFAKIILGERYVAMTEANISKNDPMAVYKSMNPDAMFLYITINNIRVSFLAFVLGIFWSLGTGYVLLSNGIMVGAFQFFFQQHGVLYESVLSIWIHGTLEIWAIIMAGAAGLMMGNSLLFPGTWSRMDALKQGAARGLKVIIGIVPQFIVAGFLEGYVTRQTHWHDGIRMAIIALSIVFIIWYYFIYPQKIYNQLWKTTATAAKETSWKMTSNSEETGILPTQ